MRYTDNGCFYTVYMSAPEVSTWARKWPCFGDTRAVWFQFDKRNGDLVDMSDTSGMDDAGVLALSDDAQNWGVALADAKKYPRKVLTVDHYRMRGCHHTEVIFMYGRNEVHPRIVNPSQREINEAMRQLRDRDQFTHWKDKSTGRVSLIWE